MKERVYDDDTAENSVSNTQQSPLSVAELEGLEKMDKAGLISLIQRVMIAGWGFPGLTGKDLVEMALKAKPDIYEALKIKGAVLASNAKEWKEFLGLASFWSDREFGKALQPNAITTDDNTLSLAELIIGAHRMGKPKVIDVTPEKTKD